MDRNELEKELEQGIPLWYALEKTPEIEDDYNCCEDDCSYEW